MSWVRFLRRDYWDAERQREIESYLEIEIADNLARGMTPVEAESAARRKFGNSTIVREEIYHMNTVSWLESIAQDIRYGARVLRNNPGFALVAVLSLALGIGANTAIFQLLDAVRLRSLPVPDPQELAEIKIVGGNHGLGMNQPYGELTRPIWEEIRHVHPAFSGVFAWSKDDMPIGEGSTFQTANALIVSGGLFQVLGVEPWRGRLIEPRDEHACPDSVAVVSHAYWQSKMGGREIDSHTNLVIDGHIKQVVGVAPPSFLGLIVGERFDIAVPFCQPKELARNIFDVTVMGRLRPGTTLSQAADQLAGMSPDIMAATEVTGYDASSIAHYRALRLGVYPASAGVSNLRNTYDASLWLLLAMTGLVLLIACANLTNLLLARASSREREIALRLALGAGRVRLIRQLLVESGLLAGAGAALGVALAAVLSRVLVWSLSTEETAVVLPTGTNWHVLLFAASVATLTCILFGLAPAFRASHTEPVTAMKSGGRGMTGNRDRFSMQRLMVVLQVSVSLVLLVGALLFVRSFRNLVTFDPGMRERAITFAVIGFEKSNIPHNRFSEFKRELEEEVRAVPGILDAAMTTNPPLMGGGWGHDITIGAVEGGTKFTWTSPEYFETMRIPLLSGRGFGPGDTNSSPKVAVVNQAFIRRFLNGANPIGRTLRTHPEPDYPSTVYEIVGTIPDTKYSNLRDQTPPMVFAPAAQFPADGPWTTMMIHSNLPLETVAASVKQRLASQHPGLVVLCSSFERRVQDGLLRERLVAMLSGFFGFVAALLAMVGLYGMMSYVVLRRRDEIAIRMAVGANRTQVVGMVMQEAGLLLTAGIVIGTGLALVAARVSTSLLFNLTPSDPLTIASAVLLLLFIGSLASFLPARRASNLDPMEALRSD